MDVLPVFTDCQSTSTFIENESPKALDWPLTEIVELESLALAIVELANLALVIVPDISTACIVPSSMPFKLSLTIFIILTENVKIGLLKNLYFHF